MTTDNRGSQTAKRRLPAALLAALCCAIPLAALSDSEESEPKQERALRIVPLITSSPLLGTGVGAAVSYLYVIGDSGSSKSQLSAGGQYSNTESYNVFANNTAWFRGNSVVSNTLTSLSSINNEFVSDDEDVAYNARTVLISELVMFEIRQSLFLGGGISFKDIRYDPNNAAGEDFIFENGISNEKTGGLSVAASFDTRTNKYYPSGATWVSLSLNAYPSWLGAEHDYYSTILNARYYAKGFKTADVWAWQLYGQYASDKAPDTGLPTLSGRSLLRGFPAGQFKARYLTGAQSEYRYQLPETKFRFIAFVGVANLAGGSFGLDGQSRDDDGWYSAAGLGVRYAIQQKTGVDLRLDVVTTSEDEQSIYVMLNQAF